MKFLRGMSSQILWAKDFEYIEKMSLECGPNGDMQYNMGNLLPLIIVVFMVEFI
jgi:hypothetical protein